MSPKSPKPLTPEVLWSIPRVGSPASTADGTVLVAPVTTYDVEENKPSTRLYLVPKTGEPVPLTAAEHSSAEPAVSPDGTRLAFVRKIKDGESQLALMRLDGGEAEVLTDLPLGLCDPKWFPDGKRVAFVGWVFRDAPTLAGSKELKEKRAKDKVQAHITEDRMFRFWDTWLTDGKVPHLFVMNVDTRELKDLTPTSNRWFDFMQPGGAYDISPDGKEIAFSADRSDPPHSPTNWDVFVVSTEGGEVKNLTKDNPADDLNPRYSPDGNFILYGMQREMDFYADKVRLAVYDRKSKKHTVLTENWDRSASEWAFVPGTDRVRLIAEDDGRTAVFTMQLAPGDPQPLRRGGAFGGLRPLADGSVLLNKNTLSAPAEIVHLSADGEKETALTAFTRETQAALKLGEVKEMRYQGARGDTIQAYVVLPPGFDPKKKWPMVAVLHGGPHGITGDNFHYRWNLQLFAASGYVVFAPNFHGSTSWGQEFAACIQGDWGDMPFADTMAGVDALLAEGYVDESRMAATGASYGGYLVTWIAGHSDRFACIVNHAGVSDTMAEYASDVTYGRGRAMGGEPWKNLDGLDRMNPIRFASGFKTPMFVIHGEKDYRVPVTQGIALYNVLQAMELPSKLLYYPDENHWVLKPQNALLWHREVQDWLARYLKPGSE